MNKIKAIIKQPYCKAYITEIENTLESYQKRVNGYIECVEMPNAEGIDIILNEEGKINGMQPNIYLPEYEDCVMGPIVIVGYDNKGRHKGLTDKQISIVMDYLNKNHIKDINEFAIAAALGFVNIFKEPTL